MRTSIIFIILSFLPSLYAAVIELPRGGRMDLKSSEWNIQETKALTGVNSLFFAHKTRKDLHGILLDGTVQNKGQCQDGKTVVCERLVPMGDKLSYQIVGQRFIGKDTYQNYVIAFTFPRAQEAASLPLLKKLKAQLEFTK